MKNIREIDSIKHSNAGSRVGMGGIPPTSVNSSTKETTGRMNSQNKYNAM